MKKVISIILACALVCSLAVFAIACTDDDKTTGDTVTITSLNASGEEFQNTVPYNPQRVAILDYAVLDMMDLFGVGDRVVSSCETTIDYLSEYINKIKNGDIINLGNLKSWDIEKLQQSEPDIIFIGGRQSAYYDEINDIAPVVYLSVDAGDLVDGTIKNAKTVAKIFGIDDDEVEELTSGLYSDVAALQAVAQPEGEDAKTCMVLMYTSDNSIGALGDTGRCSIIGCEIGFTNLYESYANTPHGESFSWETVYDLNPDYIFVLNRGYITEGGTSNASVVNSLTNSLTSGMKALQDGHLIVLENPDVWYTAEGGINALKTMISDLTSALL